MMALPALFLTASVSMMSAQCFAPSQIFEMMWIRLSLKAIAPQYASSVQAAPWEAEPGDFD
ncbi:MAG TPA: hypothetical protein VK793_06375 [Steroidobacteraceae bacterium]|nr:hypothetical protein [Steroidobacteraceae bacterium]